MRVNVEIKTVDVEKEKVYKGSVAITCPDLRIDERIFTFLVNNPFEDKECEMTISREGWEVKIVGERTEETLRTYSPEQQMILPQLVEAICSGINAHIENDNERLQVAYMPSGPYLGTKVLRGPIGGKIEIKKSSWFDIPQGDKKFQKALQNVCGVQG